MTDNREPTMQEIIEKMKKDLKTLYDCVSMECDAIRALHDSLLALDNSPGSDAIPESCKKNDPCQCDSCHCSCKDRWSTIESVEEIRKVIYVRDKNHAPIGCVVTVAIISDDPEVRLGWSLCHKEDQFTKKEAQRIAFLRAVGGLPFGHLPKVLTDAAMDIIDRTHRTVERKRGSL